MEYSVEYQTTPEYQTDVIESQDDIDAYNDQPSTLNMKKN